MFAYARQHVRQAATDLWPNAPVILEEHVPSVTGYVQRLRVGDRPLFAKLSFLGVSLVSLLRGVCGTWEEVRHAQLKYIARPHGLLDREAAQLRLLPRLRGPRTCGLAGLRRGVLFTEAVAGPTLADALLTRPEDASELLAASFAELRELHETRGVPHIGASNLIAERSIGGTFRRKFDGAGDRLRAEDLDVERCSEADRAEVVGLLGPSIARLRRARLTAAPAAQPVLVYGELKPEHILFPDGFERRPVFIDSGLMHAGISVDVAKLISRTVLLVAAVRPAAETATRVAEGIDAFVQSCAETVPCPARQAWLREVLTLWLMDSVNISSTYLAAPREVPLPTQGAALVQAVTAVCRLFDGMTAALDTEGDAFALWERVRTLVQVAGR